MAHGCAPSQTLASSGNDVLGSDLGISGLALEQLDALLLGLRADLICLLQLLANWAPAVRM